MLPHRTERTKVFISYSHEDADWLHRLRIHLRPLEREYEISIWDDTKLKPGSIWKKEIEEALQGTKVAVLLISADFLASDFITTDEIPPLLRAAEEEGAIILPIILSPCRFLRTRSLSQFQAVNDPLRPLINMTRGEQEEVLARVAEYIESSLSQSSVQLQSTETAINQDQSHDILPFIEEEGFLDLIELAQANFQTASEVTTQMSIALRNYTDKIIERTKEVNEINSSVSYDIKRAKRINDHVAEHMHELAQLLESQLPTFIDSRSRGINAYARAITLMNEEGMTSREDIKGAKISLEEQQTALTEVMHSAMGFRASVAEIRRATTALNRAKRRLLEVTDKEIEEISIGVNLISKIIGGFDEFLNT